MGHSVCRFGVQCGKTRTRGLPMLEPYRVTATSKYYNYIQVRIFTFFFRGICVVHFTATSSIILPKDNGGALWRETFTTSPEGAFPKRGNVKIFVSHSTHISDFGLWGMLSPRLLGPHLSLNTHICSNIKQLYQIYTEPP